MYLRFCVSESSSGCNTESVKQANAEECKQSDNLKKRSEYDEGHRLDGPNVVERNGIIKMTSYMKLSCIYAIILKNTEISHQSRSESEENVKYITKNQIW